MNITFGIGCIVLALAVLAGIGGICIVIGAARLRSDAEQAAEDEEQARAMGWLGTRDIKRPYDADRHNVAGGRVK